MWVFASSLVLVWVQAHVWRLVYATFEQCLTDHSCKYLRNQYLLIIHHWPWLQFLHVSFYMSQESLIVFLFLKVRALSDIYCWRWVFNTNLHLLMHYKKLTWVSIELSGWKIISLAWSTFRQISHKLFDWF